MEVLVLCAIIVVMFYMLGAAIAYIIAFDKLRSELPASYDAIFRDMAGRIAKFSWLFVFYDFDKLIDELDSKRNTTGKK